MIHFSNCGFCDLGEEEVFYLQGKELKLTFLTSKVSGLKVLKKDCEGIRESTGLWNRCDQSEIFLSLAGI